MKKFFSLLIALTLFLFSVQSVFAYTFPSTNELNKNKQTPGYIGQLTPYVELVEAGTDYVTLHFVNGYVGLHYFEYRVDGVIQTSGTSHEFLTPAKGYPNEFEYSGVCVSTIGYCPTGPTDKTINATNKVEVRLALGGENDWYFDWTEFDVLTPPDTTPPTTPEISGFKNPNLACGDITNSHYATVDWSDSTDDSGIAGYEYYVDYPLANGSGRGIWNPSNLWISSENYGSLNEGVHHIKVRAKDNAGNYSEWSNVCDITADWTAPNVIITNPGDGATVLGLVDIKGSVEDTNPDHYWLAIYKGSTIIFQKTVYRSDSFTNELLKTWDTTSIDDGEYVIKLEARDAAGNKDVGSVDSHTVTVNNTPTDMSQCKNGGWLNYSPKFKNQGTCVSYVQSNDHAGKRP